MSDNNIQPTSGNALSDLGFNPVESGDFKTRSVLVRKIKTFLLTEDAILPFALESERFFNGRDVLSILNDNFDTFNLETLTAIANRFDLNDDIRY